MKTMRITTFLCAALFALCMSAFAMQAPQDQGNGQQPPEGQHHGDQGGRHGPPSVDEMLQDLTQALNLNSDQQSKARDILTDTRKQMESIRNDDSTPRDQKMEKMRSLHEATSAKIRAILNDDQKKKFDKMEQERRERMEQRRQQHDQNP